MWLFGSCKPQIVNIYLLSQNNEDKECELNDLVIEAVDGFLKKTHTKSVHMDGNNKNLFKISHDIQNI